MKKDIKPKECEHENQTICELCCFSTLVNSRWQYPCTACRHNYLRDCYFKPKESGTMNEDTCTRCGKIIQLYEPYQEDDEGNTTHIYPERYCKTKQGPLVFRYKVDDELQELMDKEREQ